MQGVTWMVGFASMCQEWIPFTTLKIMRLTKGDNFIEIIFVGYLMNEPNIANASVLQNVCEKYKLLYGLVLVACFKAWPIFSWIKLTKLQPRQVGLADFWVKEVFLD